MGYVEVEEFALADGVALETFLAVDAEVQVWAYRHRAGLVRRTTALDGRRALVVACFSGSAPPEPPDRGAAAVAGLGRLVAPSSYRRAVYQDLDGVTAARA